MAFCDSSSLETKNWHCRDCEMYHLRHGSTYLTLSAEEFGELTEMLIDCQAIVVPPIGINAQEATVSLADHIRQIL